MPQDLPSIPLRQVPEGFGGPQVGPGGNPGMDILRQLLMQDAGSRGVGQMAPGFVDRFLRPEGQARPAERFAGLLPSIGNEQLISSMGDLQGGVNPEAHSALRNVIEQRSSDGRARGPGPSVPSVGLTTAEPEQEGLGVFKILSQALFGVNEDRRNQLAREHRGHAQ